MSLSISKNTLYSGATSSLKKGSSNRAFFSTQSIYFLQSVSVHTMEFSTLLWPSLKLLTKSIVDISCSFSWLVGCCLSQLVFFLISVLGWSYWRQALYKSYDRIYIFFSSKPTPSFELSHYVAPLSHFLVFQGNEKEVWSHRRVAMPLARDETFQEVPQRWSFHYCRGHD